MAAVAPALAGIASPPRTPITSNFKVAQTPEPQSPASFKHLHAVSPAALLTPPYTPVGGVVDRKLEIPPSKALNQLSLGSPFENELASESTRLLSDNELSYFLPSRGDGVNDMYLHHRLTSSPELMHPDRVFNLWTYQLLRHPLLASHLRVKSYEDVSFVFPQSNSVSSALMTAEERFIYIDNHPENKDIDIIDTYLNGPRTLSNSRLAMLAVADRGPSEDSEGNNYEVMLLSTHFLGDGMALHTFMNEFYTLLGSDKTSEDFLAMVQSELEGVAGEVPASLEDRMPQVGNGSRFASAIGKDDNRRNDAKLVGGQGFPSNPEKKGRKTIVPTFPYTPEETKKILATCKANGVTIAHAIFALCNLAWARKTASTQDPCLIYSALNLRPNMLKSSVESSYFHLAVGYFNIVLPTIIPADLTTSELFWHRAKMTKAQTIKAVKSPFVVARSRETNRIRRERALKWAKIDDEEDARKAAQSVSVAPNGGLGLGLGMVGQERKAPSPLSGERPGPKFAPLRANADTPAMTPSVQTPVNVTLPTPSSDKVPSETKPAVEAKSKAPVVSQKALMGVSMLGNLDGMYKHAEYPCLQLKTLTTGSRQRPGGLLLFAYTFAGKLWMSLGYDVNGFKEGAIEGFWEEVQALVREVLL